MTACQVGLEIYVDSLIQSIQYSGDKGFFKFFDSFMLCLNDTLIMCDYVAVSRGTGYIMKTTVNWRYEYDCMAKRFFMNLQNSA